ncbi:type IV secretory system conjugative DNA transfer family protein [Bradyrhizobium sp. 151]|uniref:type IV secretory system conjugative DNA transfer family protein n=1 Tax=Bradyrhizobium sp. 151 TaxID=2782626 RepID=UPI001FFAE42C|nr:type IV secretory system conjugative DNA transfer family protein [Bradyrhizobium sp. 151]
MLTLAPTRYRGSAVVLDPKGELYDATSAWRAANVGPVYRIAPFDKEGDRKTQGYPRHGFNPLAVSGRSTRHADWPSSCFRATRTGRSFSTIENRIEALTQGTFTQAAAVSQDQFRLTIVASVVRLFAIEHWGIIWVCTFFEVLGIFLRLRCSV